MSAALLWCREQPWWPLAEAGMAIGYIVEVHVPEIPSGPGSVIRLRAKREGGGGLVVKPTGCAWHLRCDPPEGRIAEFLTKVVAQADESCDDVQVYHRGPSPSNDEDVN